MVSISDFRDLNIFAEESYEWTSKHEIENDPYFNHQTAVSGKIISTVNLACDHAVIDWLELKLSGKKECVIQFVDCISRLSTGIISASVLSWLQANRYSTLIEYKCFVRDGQSLCRFTLRFNHDDKMSLHNSRRNRYENLRSD